MKKSIINFISKLRKNEFAKSVATLSSGIVLGQLITFCLTPIIGRVFSSTDIGAFSLLTSNAALISTVVSLGLLTAIMLPKEDDEARQICTTVLISVTALATVLLAAALLLSSRVQLFKISLDYGTSCILLYIYIILDNLSNIFYSFVNREKKYKVLFANPIIIAAVNGGVSILFGVLGLGAIGYTLGTLAAQAVSIVFLAFFVKPFILSRKKLAIKDTLKKYKEFPLVVLPSNFVSMLTRQLPVQMLSRIFDEAVVGSYSMATRILQLPINFLATPVNRVYYKEAAQRYANGENIGEFSFSILTANIKLAIIPIAVLTVFGELLFSLFLGKQWETAGYYASILAFYELVSFCNGCLSGKFVIIGKAKTVLSLNIISVLHRFGVFIVCKFVGASPSETLYVFAITGALVSFIDLSIFFSYTNIQFKKVIRFAVIYLVFPIVCVNLLRVALRLIFPLF